MKLYITSNYWKHNGIPYLQITFIELSVVPMKFVEEFMPSVLVTVGRHTTACLLVIL